MTGFALLQRVMQVDFSSTWTCTHMPTHVAAFCTAIACRVLHRLVGFARWDVLRLLFGLQVWNVAFARICELNGPHFDFEGCEFPPTSDKVPVRLSL